jgi:ubiquinone/menaquinone biosynthesis C-methylase UbiE
MAKAVPAEERVTAVRAKLAERFISGCGLEVGAGSRPFPVPSHAQVVYGDIRERAALESYFKTRSVSSGQRINAQTLAGVADNSLDFVISAHVIEHLLDPIGAIANAIRVLKRGGIHILAVPDMRRTFDRHRPETTVAHALADFRDGGLGTCKAGYEEHLRYVHPVLTGQHYSETEIQRQATEAARLWPKYGAHFHAWTRAGFEALLRATYEFAPFGVVTEVSVAKENLFVSTQNFRDCVSHSVDLEKSGPLKIALLCKRI